MYSCNLLDVITIIPTHKFVVYKVGIRHSYYGTFNVMFVAFLSTCVTWNRGDPAIKCQSKNKARHNADAFFSRNKGGGTLYLLK